jgi:hypothetical protein
VERHFHRWDRRQREHHQHDPDHLVHDSTGNGLDPHGGYIRDVHYGDFDLDRNLWGNAGTEINGAASLVGLDASTGAVDINTANFFFGQTVQAEPGKGNVGDFSLSISDTAWGTLLKSTANLDGLLNPFDNSPWNDGSPVTDVGFNGLAFDLSDFVGTGTLSGVAGIQIFGGGTFDPVVVGFAVPEPTSALLLATGLAGLALRRRLAA